MTEKISNRALISALVSIKNDIDRQRASLAEGENEREDGEVLLEMERAIGEFLSIYRKRFSEDKKLPPIEKLLGPEWI